MFYTSKIPLSSYETVKEQLRQSGVKYKSFDWEIVDKNYGASVLRGVNNSLWFKNQYHKCAKFS